MKKNIFKFAILAMVIAFSHYSCNSGNEKNDSSIELQEVLGDSSQLYAIEKGMIEFETSTLIISSISKFFWKDYGNTSFTTTNSKIIGQNIVSYILNDSGFVYTWTSESDKGNIIKMQNSGNVNFNYLTKDICNKYNISLVGNETIKGKKCNIYEMKNDEAESKLWIWKGITIKSESKTMGMKVKNEMIDIEENIDAPDGTFELPKNIEFEEIDLDKLKPNKN